MRKTSRLLESDQSDMPKEEPENEAPLSILGQIRESTGQGRIWEVTLIRSGWSINGAYYSPECLREALPLFEGVPIAMYTWADNKARHLPQPDREAGEGPGGNVVGFAVRPRIVQEGDNVEVRAELHLTRDDVAGTLMAADRAGAPYPLGLSIDGIGDIQQGIQEGRSGRIVRRISELRETTLVSNPSAGGRIVRLVAGADEQQEDEEMGNLKKLWKSRLRKAGKSDQDARIDGLSEAQLCEEIIREGIGDKAILTLISEWVGAGKTEEAQQLLAKMIEESGGDAEAPMMEGPAPAIQEAVDIAKQARAELDAARKLRCRHQLDTDLSASKLPDAAQAVLRKRFEGRLFEAKELTEAISDARTILGTTPLAGVTQPAASASIRLGHNGVDRCRAELELAAGYKPKLGDQYGLETISEADMDLYRDVRRSRPSIRRASELLLGDPGLTGNQGQDALLQEATSANYLLILKNAQHKSLVQEYREIQDIWEKLVTINPSVEDFKQQESVRWGGFTGMPLVSEQDSGEAYAFLGNPGEAITGYSVATRGVKYALTRKMLKNDDLNAFALVPRKLARSARHELRTFIFNYLLGRVGGTIGADTIYDGIAVAHLAHRNRTTSALAYDPVVAAWQRMTTQQQIGISTALTADMANNATSATVASTKGFAAGDVIKIGGELILVAGVTDATTLDITGGRAQGGTTAAAATSGAKVWGFADPVGIDTVHLVVPIELSDTAFKLVSSPLLPGTANNDGNMLAALYREGKLTVEKVHSQYLGKDTNNWYLYANKEDAPTVEMAFLDNRQEPELFVEDLPNTGSVFANDSIVYKVRHEYGAAIIDYVGAQFGIVA